MFSFVSARVRYFAIFYFYFYSYFFYFFLFISTHSYMKRDTFHIYERPYIRRVFICRVLISHFNGFNSRSHFYVKHTHTHTRQADRQRASPSTSFAIGRICECVRCCCRCCCCHCSIIDNLFSWRQHQPSV